MEIGCYNGFTSSAILEAWKVYTPKRVDFVDAWPTPDFRQLMLSQQPPAGCVARLCDMPSQSYTAWPECWIVDGDHGLPAATIDYENARRASARIVVAHDVNHRDEKPRFYDGAREVGERIMRDAAVTFSDNKDRPGEWTFRGLIIGFYYVPKPETLAALRAVAEQ